MTNYMYGQVIDEYRAEVLNDLFDEDDESTAWIDSQFLDFLIQEGVEEWPGFKEAERRFEQEMGFKFEV